MASIVSAGTTSATALNMSADTTGVLQLASNNGTVALTVNTSQNVGIGTASPVSLYSVTTLQITGNLKLGSANDRGLVSFGDVSSGAANAAVWRGTGGAYGSAGNFLCLGGYEGITFTTGFTDIGSQTERMRIDSNGVVLAGTTNTNSLSAEGFRYFTASGAQYGGFTRTSNPPFFVCRLTSDGEMVQFFRDGTQIGSMGTNGAARFFIAGGDTGLDFEPSTDAIRPCSGAGGGRDNAIDLGRPDVRFRTAYITNGVVTGSDLNDKQDIEVLNEAETRVAIACRGLLRKWRWKESVAEKGDAARTHFGIVAQELKAAFEAEGLDAGRYSMFIWNEWWESSETYVDNEGLEKIRINTYQKQDDAPEGATKKERMGIQYSELLAFMVAVL